MAFVGRTLLGQMKDLLLGRRGEILTSDAGSEWFDHEAITVSTTVVRLDSAKISVADRALITVEAGTSTSDDIRWRVDGQAVPSTTVGHRGYDKDVILLSSATEMERFRAIRRASVDATLRVTYGR